MVKSWKNTGILGEIRTNIFGSLSGTRDYRCGKYFPGGDGINAFTDGESEFDVGKSDQYDLGVDMDLLEYRLKFKLDYYYKYTKAKLWQVTLPGTVYFHTSMWDNAMEISNEGLELETQFDILRETAVSWRLRFNISRNWNRLEKHIPGWMLMENT